MTIDSNRASIISSAGQTRSLHLNAEDTHIPPRATLIIRPSQAAAFGTSIDEMFSPSQLSRSDRESFFAERDYLKQFVGTLLRLYLPISIDGKERVYDIPLEIRSVSQAGVPDR
jgi:hypothetical protein